MLWLAVFLIAASAEPTPAVCATSAPAGPVLAVARGIIVADNRRAIDEVMALYAPDAVLWHPNEARVRGAEAIRQRYEKLFAQYTPELATVVDSVCVGGRLAVVQGRVNGRMVARSGSSDRTVQDAYLMALELSPDGTWRISHLVWRPEDGDKDRSTPR